MTSISTEIATAIKHTHADIHDPNPQDMHKLRQGSQLYKRSNVDLIKHVSSSPIYPK